MADYSSLIAANQQRWEVAKYHDHAKALAAQVAERLVAPKAKAVYQVLESTTGVPWYAIAMIHEREASQSWKANIAQGDPWNRKSIHVPKGRGPFNSFIDAAVDALTNCPPYAARWKDWSMGGLLTLLELYNGIGYEKYHKMASPYIWAGSDQYTRGKYVSDGHFDPTVVDSQLGCAVLLHAMAERDPSITIDGSVTEPVTEFEDGPPEVDDTMHGSPRPTPIAENQRVDEDYSFPDAQKVPDWLGKQARNPVVQQAGKSLWKSRIGWASIGLAGTSTATAMDKTPATVLDSISALVQTPMFWLIVLNIGLAGFILYRYWRDHGKGST